MRPMTINQAIREAIANEMARDRRVVLFGESVEGSVGGTEARGLTEAFPDQVFDTPITENSTAGMALGMALCGYRPIVHTMMAGFMLGGFEETVPIAANWRAIHGAKAPPIASVTIAPGGGGVGMGQEHTVFPTGLLAHFPGLKIAVPSNAADAKGLMTAAIRDPNPVVILPHLALTMSRGDVPEGEYVVSLGKARTVRTGTQATIAASSLSTVLSMTAADRLSAEGVDVDVIDLRTLEPLDLPAILESVARTGRLVVVDDDIARCGMSAEISALVMEQGFESLRAPVQRVARSNLALLAGETLESAMIPSVDKIIAAVRETLAY